MTRSVPPRTSVVANVCRRVCTVVSSSRPAAAAIVVMMSWAPRTLSRCPRWLRSGALVSAWPVGAFGEPARDRGPELRVDRDVADAFAFAEDS
jgi:hypothetical protein